MSYVVSIPHNFSLPANSKITSVHVPESTDHEVHIKFHDGAVLRLRTEATSGITGPVLHDNTSAYNHPIIDMCMIVRVNPIDQPIGTAYTTATLHFITMNGPYTITWQCAPGIDAPTFLLETILPVNAKSRLFIEGDLACHYSIDDLMDKTITHIDTNNLGRETAVTLDNHIILTTNTTAHAHDRIAALRSYKYQKLATLVEDEMLDLT